MDELLIETLVFVKNASPEVWEAYIRQVYMNAVELLAWVIFLLVIIGVLGKIALGIWRESDDLLHEPVYFLTCFFGAIAGIIAFALLVSGLKMLANPEYYAIQWIVAQVGR